MDFETINCMTNFPEDRWVNWKGNLNKGDESFIFTENVLNDLSMIKTDYFNKWRNLPEYLFDQAAENATEKLFIQVKEICVKNEYIHSSLKGLLHSLYKKILYTELVNAHRKYRKELDTNKKITKAIIFENSSNQKTFQPSTEDLILKEEILTALSDCIEKLKERDKQLILEIYYNSDSKNLTQIALEFGISSPKMTFIKDNIHKQLRECLSKKGISL